MAKRWEAESPTKGKKLPEHVKKAAMREAVLRLLNKAKG